MASVFIHARDTRLVHEMRWLSIHYIQRLKPTWNPPCTSETCTVNSKRFKTLDCFVRHVKQLARFYAITSQGCENPALHSYDDLLALVMALQSKPTKNRGEITREAFEHRSGQSMPSVTEQAKAINLAVRIAFMISCGSQEKSADLLELGLQPKVWTDHTMLDIFIGDCFPHSQDPTMSNGINAYRLGSTSSLTAYALKTRAGIKFRPTHDLRHHLKYDKDNNVVEIFHHVGFLKSQLLSSALSLPIATEDWAKRSARLPRRLVLETLDSIQKILFSELDAKSHSMLKSLCASSHFDAECLRYEGSALRSTDDEDVVYYYWGARFEELSDELENPTPRGWIQIWLERKSGGRYVMLATLIGVVFAVLLGMASLLVSCYQTWISYEAWKHPVHI